MPIKIANNAATTLGAGITNVATTITLAAGTGALFPTLGAGDYFYATIVDTSNYIEIVKVTARATDTLTVVRSQEGTTAKPAGNVVGDGFELRLTAQSFYDYITSLASFSGSAAGGDLSGTYPNPTVAAGAVTVAKLSAAAAAYDLAFNAGYAADFTANNLAVQTYNEVIVPRAITLTGEYGYLETVSAGAAVIVDILQNGVSVFSVLPQFAAAATALTSGTLSTTSIVAGDRITFKVTQVGSTTPGARMRFTLKGNLA